MKRAYLTLSVCFLLGTSFLIRPRLNSIKDLKDSFGSWTGTLTYLDYTSGKPYTMPANILVSGLSDSSLGIAFTYPNEPKANGIDTLILSAGGSSFNGAGIESFLDQKKGFQLITLRNGQDGNDNKEAIIRTTYSCDDHSFKMIKDVRFKGTDTWINRHVYAFMRK